MREPTRVALIGAGLTAREHARAFKDAGADIAAIFSRTRPRANALATEFGIPIVCESIEELHGRSQAQLVVVCVNELSTNAVSKACFEYDWSVLLEKPPGHDLDDSRDILAAATSKNRRVHVALNRRCLSATRSVHDDLANAKGPRFIKVQDQQSPARARDAGVPPRVAANWMFANSIHLIDYFAHFGRGPVADVTHVVPWDAARPSIVLAKLAFDSGDVGLYEGIWEAPGPWAVTVTVPGQRWEMRPLEQLSTQRLGGPATTIANHEWDSTFKPGFRRQAECALAAVQGRDSGELPSLDAAVRTMELIRRIFPS